ncbi:unnamed protein product [Closterium sp. NIES-53]
MSEQDEPDRSPRGTQEVTRVYVVSDIHTDHAENMEWVERLAATCQRSEGSRKGRDVLILAGDVTDNLEVLSRTFQLLTSAFHHVFFIPGNHELWCRHHDHHTHHSHHTQHQQHSEHTQPSNHDHQRHSQHSNTGGKGGELPAGIPPSSVPASPEPFTSLHKLTKVLQCCERLTFRTSDCHHCVRWATPPPLLFPCLPSLSSPLSPCASIRLYSPLFASIRIYSSLFAFIRLYSPLFVSIHLYSPLFVSLRLYSPLFASIRLYSPLFVSIRLYSSLFASIRLYSSLFVSIRLYSSLFASIRLYSSLFASIRLYSLLFASIRLYSPLFVSIRLYST